MDPLNHKAWRILDANFNRAREALRVIEEYARFCLNDGGITDVVKATRHRLCVAMGRIDDSHSRTGAEAAGQRLAARDIVGDVGQAATTATEYERSGTDQVAMASCRRLTEALRGLEEYGKVVDVQFAVEIERIRYEAYEIERRLALTVRGRKRFGDVKLYVLITEALCRHDWLATAKAALSGGADALQLREPSLSDLELLARAKRLADFCHEHSALLLVNNRADVAAASGADGVHVGQDDLPVAEARRLLPPHGLVGLSTHTMEQIESGLRAMPDYLAVGPMFPSATKPQDHVAGTATLAAARSRTSLPLVAIGGIDEGHVAKVRAVAECCVCVCQAITTAVDVAEATSRLKAAMTAATTCDDRQRGP